MNSFILRVDRSLEKNLQFQDSRFKQADKELSEGSQINIRLVLSENLSDQGRDKDRTSLNTNRK